MTPRPCTGLSKAAQLGKGRSQKQRSAKRKRAWRGEQEKAHATLPPVCERCKEPLPDGVQPINLSHVKHRGMGGSWDKKQNTLAAVRVLCRKCHNKHPNWNGD